MCILIDVCIWLPDIIIIVIGQAGRDWRAVCCSHCLALTIVVVCSASYREFQLCVAFSQYSCSPTLVLTLPTFPPFTMIIVIGQELVLYYSNYLLQWWFHYLLQLLFGRPHPCCYFVNIIILPLPPSPILWLLLWPPLICVALCWENTGTGDNRDRSILVFWFLFLCFLVVFSSVTGDSGEHFVIMNTTFCLIVVVSNYSFPIVCVNYPNTTYLVILLTLLFCICPNLPSNIWYYSQLTMLIVILSTHLFCFPSQFDVIVWLV